MAALSNKERVGRVLDLVAAGLGPWMAERLTKKYGEGWQSQVRAAAGSQPREFTDKVDDPSYLFWVFDKQWVTLFKDHLGHEERRCVSALWDARKEWAHAGRFTDEQAERVLSDGEHLLRAVGSIAPADHVDEMRRELRRIRFEKDQKASQAAAEAGLSVKLETTGLPAWREIAEPHDDVAHGTFQLAQFAADLRQVTQGVARPEYGDPVQFFDRTFITRGLRYLLAQTIQRLNGVGGEPVIDLMTTFGGGKTHSEIAVYHVAGGTPSEALQGVQDICDSLGLPGVPAGVNRAVIVGNDFSVLGMTKADGTVVNTMWGELAWQLGGRAGYDRVARYDEASVPPPTSDLADLISTHAPCVILIDEWVAYLRQLWSRSDDDPFPAGTFDGHQTFVQSLTEAVKAVDTALLVVSLPASDSVRDMGEGVIDNAHEVGGTPGLEALRSLRSVIHRVETPWQPASVDESYEIVRRRIFKPITGDKAGARDLVVNRFAQFYDMNKSALPSEVQQSSYKDVMRAAYPIHPEMFDRLYQDWSTLERFQRTRGVLRLMATVVHALWVRGDQSAMILPATIPLDDTKVFEEITSHLDDPWKPIVDADIAGDGSTAATIDRDYPQLGKSMAGKRVARCVFLGTAPMTSKNARNSDSGPVRGVEQKRVVLGSTYPGDNPSLLADALRQLGDRGAYMNRDQDRYWLSLQQTVSRLVQERADGYDERAVAEELAKTIREETDRGIFERVHRLPTATGEVDDEPTIGLVILGTDQPHSKRAGSEAMAAAQSYIDKRGSQPRIHKNTLVFLAPDLGLVDTLHGHVRRRMAWQSVVDNVKGLNLDQHNIAVARSRLDQAITAVKDTIREAYKWIIVPYQESGSMLVEFDTILMNGNGTLAERTTKKIDATETVYREYAPALLRQQIDRLDLWQAQPHISVETLSGYFTDYLYMPKVRNHDVVRSAIRALDNVLHPEIEGFAYADGIDESGRYRGLVLGIAPTVVSPTGLVVKPDVAQAQIDAEEPPLTPPGPTPPGPGPTPPGPGPTPPGPTPPGPTPLAGATRFHATKDLDPQRSVRDVSQIAAEILSLFNDNAVAVKVSIDLSSQALSGLTQDQVAALKENLNTLGFTDWSVE